MIILKLIDSSKNNEFITDLDKLTDPTKENEIFYDLAIEKFLQSF